ncbi:MAG: PQQ-binding-like beta-propeller repeat protein [Planctomycetota bacterium]
MNASAQDSKEEISGIVFYDRNRNGVRDVGEPGQGNIEVSNGAEIVKSGADGKFMLAAPTPSDANEPKTILINRNLAYETTTPWFIKIAEPKQKLQFGVISGSATGKSDRIVHINNLDLTKDEDTDAALAVLSELNQLPKKPALVVATGLTNAEKFLQKSPFLIVTPWLNRDVERYSVDAGSMRVLSIPRWLPESKRFIENTIQNLAVCTGIVIVCEEEAPQNILELLSKIPNYSVFISKSSGSGVTVLHESESNATTSKPASRPESRPVVLTDPKIVACATPPLLEGGADGSPRAYRILQIHPKLETEPWKFTTELRSLGAKRRVQVMWPQAGAAVPRAPIDVRVSACDSFTNIVSAKVSIVDSAGMAMSSPLFHAGGDLYHVRLDGTKLALGKAQAIITFTDDRGAEWEARNGFGISENTNAKKPFEHNNWAIERSTQAGYLIAEIDIVPPLRPLWTAAMDGPSGTTSPIIVNGKIYCSSDATFGGGAIYGFDILTGKPILNAPSRKPLGNAILASSASYLRRDQDSGEFQVLYFTDRSANTVDLRNGKFESEERRFYVPRVASGSPPSMQAFLAEAGVVPASSHPGYRLKIKQGILCGYVTKREQTIIDEPPTWQFEGHCNRPPTIGNNDTFIAVIDRKLTCIEAITGKQIWQNPNDLGDAPGAPVITNHGIVVVPGADAKLFAMDITTGKSAWTWNSASIPLEFSVPGEREGRAIGGTPVAFGNYCYFGCTDGRLYAVDLRAGVTKWWFRIGSPIVASVAASGNILVVTTRDGQIHAFTEQ